MKQLLDRLIPSDDSHTVITENKLYGIEVIECNLMTFRVPCKSANSPAKFMVSFNDAIREDTPKAANNAGDELTAVNKSAISRTSRKVKEKYGNKDLKIYVSQEEKEPKEDRCDASYYSENVFFVHTVNK